MHGNLKYSMWLIHFHSLKFSFRYRKSFNFSNLCKIHLVELKTIRMVSATLRRTEEDGEVLLSGVAEAWREAQVEQFRKRRFWTMSFCKFVILQNLFFCKICHLSKFVICQFYFKLLCCRASLMIFTCSVLEEE